MFIVFHSDSGVEERGFSLDYSTSYGKIKYSKALSIVMCRYVHKSNYSISVHVYLRQDALYIIVYVVVIFDCSFYCICRVVDACIILYL
jgi:hypothetical protein